MRRNLLFTIIVSALVPASAVWAAPNTNTSATQYVSQINEQAFQIQTDAEHLEQYVRSGADDWSINASVTSDVADEARKLLALLDQVAARPGATNDTRQQVEKMKVLTAEVLAFDGNALSELAPRGLALRAKSVLANADKIQDLCNSIRSASQSLLTAR